MKYLVNTWWGCLIAAVFFGFLLFVYYKISKKEWEINKKERAENEKTAQEIINFLKKEHTFSDLKNPLSEVTDLGYWKLLDVNFEEKFRDDTPISIVLYYDDKTVQNEIVKMLDDVLYSGGKIGKVQFWSK